MKKFFSLVLALVMALSLTTVAFGADIDSKAELQAALDAATGNAVITLTGDITDGDVTVTQKEGVNLTIDGAGYKFTGTIYIHGASRHTGAETLTIKNIVFTTDKQAHDFISSNSTASAERYAHNVTIQGCSFTTTYDGDDCEVVATRFRQSYNIQMIDCTVTGLHSAMWATGCDEIVVDELDATDCLNGISTGTTVDVTVTDSVVETTSADGYGIRTNAEAAGSLVVDDCTIEAFIPVLVRNTTSDDYEVTMSGDNDLTATNTDGYDVAFAQGDYEANGTLVEPTASPSFVNSGSAVNTNAVAAGSGVANNGATSGVYAKGTWNGAVLQKNVTVNYFKAVDNKVDKKTGAHVADGTVAYYMIDGVVTQYEKVNTVSEADMVIYTDAACKNVYMCLAVVDPVYYGDATVFTNFGDMCGQYDEDDTDYDDEASYYTAFNKLYVGVEPGAAYEKQLMVNGKLVQVDEVNDITKLAHKTMITTDKKGTITSVECTVCGLDAVKAGNYASIPAAAVAANLVVTGPDAAGAYWYFPVATAGTTTDVKVESAATFDAGIAMYVGMSVLAATGSAVVLKKRER